MGDLGFFALGLLVGALAPAMPGLFAGPAFALALAALCGLRDGKSGLRARRVGSWAPALVGLLAVPLFLISILKEQLYGERAEHSGLTMSGAIALLSTVAVLFVAVTLSVSALVRRRRDRAVAP